MFTRALALATLCLAGATAQATDFGPLMGVARETWPAKTRIAVVGNYAACRPEIQDLAEASGPDCRIVVLDACGPSTSVPNLVANLVKPDYVVLLRNDRTYREGSVWSTWMVRRLAVAGIPTIGTTPMALAQGGVFAVGADTGGQVLVNQAIKGSIHVVLPQRVARAGQGRAEIQLARLGGH